MKVIYDGLRDGLNVIKYAKPELSWDKMLNIYNKLKKEKESQINDNSQFNDEYYNSKEEILNLIEKIKRKVN